MAAGFFEPHMERSCGHTRRWMNILERPGQHITEERLDRIVYHLEKPRIEDDPCRIAVLEQDLLWIGKMHLSG